MYKTITTENPMTVFTGVMATLEPDARIKMGQKESVTRNLRYAKRRNMPPEPARLSDLALDVKFKSTCGPSPQEFLIYDNDQLAAERLLIFSSPNQLRQLTFAEKFVNINYIIK